MTTYTVTAANWNDPLFWASISEASGGHMLDFSGLAANFDVIVDKATGTVTLTDGATTFTVAEAGYGGSSDATLGGGTLWDYFATLGFGGGDQAITGDAAAEAITTGAGDDTIDAGGGNDTIFYGDGADTVRGGDGDDRIDDAAGINSTSTGSRVDAGAGNDTVFGAAGDDTLLGGTGNDRLDGEAGTDHIQGGAGADTISGGAGNDRIASDDFTATGPNLIVNGSFEDTTGMTAASFGHQGTGGSIPGWTDSGGNSVDYHNDGRGGLSATDGANWLDMEGGGGQQLAISQTVAGLQPDDVYQLSFDIGDKSDGNDGTALDNTVDVYWNGELLDSIDPPDGNWQTYTYHVTGASGDGTGTLEFRGAGATDSEGASIDSVSLHATTEAAGAADSVTGGSGDDVIFTGAGDDTATGGSGADTIHAGTGADTVSGGSDADRILIADGFGNDSITGGEGVTTGSDSDTIDGSGLSGPVTLTLSGSEAGTLTDGTDTLSFTEVENVFTGAGDDNLDASADSVGLGLFGADGDDTITGGSGADHIEAGTGADRVAGGGGDDTIDLGAHDGAPDTLAFSDGDGADVIAGFEGPVDNGDGTFTGRDQLDLSGATDAAGNQINTRDITVGDDGFGNALLSLPNGDSITLVGIAPADVADADAFAAMGVPAPDDIVEGTSGADSIDATYTGDPEGDAIDAGDNAAGTDADRVEAGAGDDTVVAGAGNDTIYGRDGNDSLLGGDGNDLLDARGGNGYGLPDTGYNDPANPGLNYAADSNPFDDRDIVDGGGGDDRILTGDDNDVITGGAGDDTIDAGFDADSITGDAGADEIEGNAGRDTVDGGTGNDLIYGDISASNPLYPYYPLYNLPNDGTDRNPDDHADSILGGDGDDTIFGQDDDDTISGGQGHDVLDGGLDDDVISGGDGDDSIILSDNFGNDTIDGGALSETGGDTLDASGMTQDVVLDLGQNGAADPESGLIADGIDFATFTEIENITLGAGNDLVFGSAEADSVSTGAGDDTIDGGTGADSFDAGAGNDSITVDQGDTVQGGVGDDTFRLADLDTTGTGNAAIDITGGEGAETNGDTLILTPDVSYGDLLFSDSDPGTGMSGSFTMADGTPVTFSEIENIICFTPGTMILTSHGDRPVETLQVGDMVVTRDQGLRPIRWVGARTVRGHGRFAPIRVGANALDPTRKGLLVSPQHRILYTGYRAELLFGESEVLVPAKHLVDGRDVLRQPCDEVTYIHLMFDHHEVIYAEGFATESFHAGDVGLDAIEEAAREELFALFPELRTAPGHHLETARTCLKKHEAALLIEDTDGPHY
ncbi:Hint domain-containing protein [Roseovarius sp. B08]|uniref:Hint domain-containing protein n=1 Tax=Roseovarius sp. B08 TaxID=3449223 RepID=UPI003EDC7EBF